MGGLWPQKGKRREGRKCYLFLPLSELKGAMGLVGEVFMGTSEEYSWVVGVGGCLRQLSIVVINSLTKSSLWRKGFISFYSL